MTFKLSRCRGRRREREPCFTVQVNVGVALGEPFISDDGKPVPPQARFKDGKPFSLQLVSEDGKIIFLKDLTFSEDGRVLLQYGAPRFSVYESSEDRLVIVDSPEWPRSSRTRSEHIVLSIAVRLLPQSERDRYLEEFRAELLDVPPNTRLTHALSLLRGVFVLRLRRGLKNKATDASVRRAKG